MAIQTLIRAGLLVDGTAGPARRTDLSVADGAVVGVGAPGRRETSDRTGGAFGLAVGMALSGCVFAIRGWL